MATSGISEALFRMLWDIWNADAGAAMGNSVADSRVQNFMRDDDRRINPADPQLGIIAPPAIIVHIHDEEEDGFGTGTGSKLGGEVFVDFEIITRKDLGSSSESGTAPAATDEDNIRRGLKDLYHEKAIQSTAGTALGWNAQRPVRLGPGARIPHGTMNRTIERYIVQMSQI